MKAKTPEALHYGVVQGPRFPVYVAATARGVARIHLGGTEPDFVRDLQQRFGARIRRDDRTLAGERAALAAYLAGRSKRLDLELDLAGLRPFQARVLGALRRVPFGCVVSYGELARQAGCPRAARAVGQALGSNPLPLVLPCHRVISQDGSIGGFTGGLALKRVLLELEGVELPLSGTARLSEPRADRSRRAPPAAARGDRRAAPTAPPRAGTPRRARSR